MGGESFKQGGEQDRAARPQGPPEDWCSESVYTQRGGWKAEVLPQRGVKIPALPYLLYGLWGII